MQRNIVPSIRTSFYRACMACIVPFPHWWPEKYQKSWTWGLKRFGKSYHENRRALGREATRLRRISSSLYPGSSVWMKSQGSFDFSYFRNLHPDLVVALCSCKVDAVACYGTTHSGYGTTPVGCRVGNRYVEGDLLVFGELMLDDSLGYPYYRLFHVRWFPWIYLLSAI